MSSEVQNRIIQKQATQIGNLAYTQTALEAERDMAVEENAQLKEQIASLQAQLEDKNQPVAKAPEPVTVKSEVVQED